jgi:hypothetical protein
MDWLRKAPTPLVITMALAVTVATLAYLGGYVYLSATGVDTTEYRALLNTAFNYAGTLFGATTVVASVAAAKSSNKTEHQTNGTLTALHEEIADLKRQLAAGAGAYPSPVKDGFTQGGPV